jgi:hypothetical protein
MAFSVDYFTLDASSASQKYVDMSGTPSLPNNVALDLISGTAQSLNGDFAVDGTRIKWDSTVYGLYSQLVLGDKLRVIYDKS